MIVEWAGFDEFTRRGPEYARLSMRNGALGPAALFELWRARDLAEFLRDARRRLVVDRVLAAHDDVAEAADEILRLYSSGAF